MRFIFLCDSAEKMHIPANWNIHIHEHSCLSICSQHPWLFNILIFHPVYSLFSRLVFTFYSHMCLLFGKPLSDLCVDCIGFIFLAQHALMWNMIPHAIKYIFAYPNLVIPMHAITLYSLLAWTIFSYPYLCIINLYYLPSYFHTLSSLKPK